MLKFADGTQVVVMGLGEIMADLYAEGKQATDDTAEEIIHRLEEKRNFISESERVRREYAHVLLREYRAYLKDLSDSIRD